jgi:hypothetical protein
LDLLFNLNILYTQNLILKYDFYEKFHGPNFKPWF